MCSNVLDSFDARWVVTFKNLGLIGLSYGNWSLSKEFSCTFLANLSPQFDFANLLVKQLFIFLEFVLQRLERSILEINDLVINDADCIRAGM